MMMAQPTIRIELSIDQLNSILMTLGKRPFEEVADLIVDIRNQATPQVQQHQQRAQVAQTMQPMPAPRPANGTGHAVDDFPTPSAG